MLPLGGLALINGASEFKPELPSHKLVVVEYGTPTSPKTHNPFF